MPVYAMSTFVRCAVVPAEGAPILFEHGNSMHRSAGHARGGRASDARVGVLRRPRGGGGGLGARDDRSRRGAWASRDGPWRSTASGRPGSWRCSALDSRSSTRRRRRRRRARSRPRRRSRSCGASGALIVDMLSAFEAAVAPGVRECDLLAVLSRHDAARRRRVPRHEHRVLRARTRTPGEPRPPIARCDRASSSSSTPTRWGSAATSSASHARSPCPGAPVGRAATGHLPGRVRLAPRARGPRASPASRAASWRARPRTCRQRGSPALRMHDPRHRAWRRRAPASATRSTRSPTPIA